MKTKLFFGVALCLLFSSCIKNYVGQGTEEKKMQLTSENYLYDGALERIFLEEQISRIDDEINQLDQKDPKREELSKQQANFKHRITQLVDLGSIGLDFPIPCDQPNGKCVPVRLEFIIFHKSFKETLTVIDNKSGKMASSELVDLPDFENQLQYVRFPVLKDENEIKVQVFKTDTDGIESKYEIVLKN